MLLRESMFVFRADLMDPIFFTEDFEVRSFVFQVTMNASKSSRYRSEKQNVSIIS